MTRLRPWIYRPAMVLLVGGLVAVLGAPIKWA